MTAPAHDVESDDESGSEFDWHCFAELVDHLVDVIRVEHDQEHTAAPAMWCEHAICSAGKLWDSLPGLLSVVDELIEAARDEHDRGHAAPLTFCNDPLCVSAKRVLGARD